MGGKRGGCFNGRALFKEGDLGTGFEGVEEEGGAGTAGETGKGEAGAVRGNVRHRDQIFIKSELFLV